MRNEPAREALRRIAAGLPLVLFAGCASPAPAQRSVAGNGGQGPALGTSGGSGGEQGGAHLPLALIEDVDLPGRATRFDYQDIDPDLGRLVVTHMNDDSVLFINLADGAVLGQVSDVPVARGVVVADDAGLVFVTSSPNTLVLIDNTSMTVSGRVDTGNGPDGVAWDPADKIVGVSDQGDGALSLIPNSGRGTRQQIKLGAETGNAVFDGARGLFWITVVGDNPPDQLVAVDPGSARVSTAIDLPGCSGAHGLRIHPDGKSAFVACESNATLVRVDLDRQLVLDKASCGADPDVLSIDPGLGWLYVAAESADLTVFDLNQPGVSLIGHDQPGPASHSVTVEPTTHRVFFPLVAGPNGTPVLRIMQPSGL